MWITLSELPAFVLQFWWEGQVWGEKIIIERFYCYYATDISIGAFG